MDKARKHLDNKATREEFEKLSSPPRPFLNSSLELHPDDPLLQEEEEMENKEAPIGDG
jgi:hypothetical protein